jgi:putative hydrolase of the HAD superfamily
MGAPVNARGMANCSVGVTFFMVHIISLSMSTPKPNNFETFALVDTWIFDLDNTLYSPECALFVQIDKRMNAFLREMFEVGHEEAHRIQKHYYHKYGTTLSGLMKEHNLQPESFLEYVHDIDLSVVPEAPALGRAIEQLPGRKFIFTNGSRQHAERVATKLGVLQHFDDLFDIVAGDYTPKPAPVAYARFLEAHGVEAKTAAMFEDLPHNLENPHALGMATVLVCSGVGEHPSQKAFRAQNTKPAHIHHVTDDLAAFLEDVLAATAPAR